MEVDWNSVKKLTLWHYDDLIKKMLVTLSYNFIQNHYNHDMQQASSYVRRLMGYSLKYEESIRRLTRIFKTLDKAQIKNYTDLMHTVETREKCVKFLENTQIPFGDLIYVLNYIFRWVLPFRNVYLRQLVNSDDMSHMAHIKSLRDQDITFNLDVLECCRTSDGRTKLSQKAGIPEDFILDLVNRADLTRLPYMNRKTVEHLCNAGYDTVCKLAEVETGKLREDMKSHFDKMHIRLGSFIDMEGLVEWARAVPKIVEK